MEITDLFLTVEQSKKLLELGMTMQDSAFMWIKIRGLANYQLTPAEGRFINHTVIEYVPTYTLEEVMKKLKPIEYHDGHIYECRVDETRPYVIGYSRMYYFEDAHRFISTEGSTLLNAAYRLLVAMIEYGHLKAE